MSNIVLLCVVCFRDQQHGMERHIPVIFLNLNGTYRLFKKSFQTITFRFNNRSNFRASFFTLVLWLFRSVSYSLSVLMLWLLLFAFLAEDMTTSTTKEGLQVAVGLNSLLPKEHGAKFFTLPLVKNVEKDVRVQSYLVFCTYHWNSHLSRFLHNYPPSANTEQLCTCRLSHCTLISSSHHPYPKSPSLVSH